jgi:hypothetical protein
VSGKQFLEVTNLFAGELQIQAPIGGMGNQNQNSRRSKKGTVRRLNLPHHPQRNLLERYLRKVL